MRVRFAAGVFTSLDLSDYPIWATTWSEIYMYTELPESS